jgi:pimeloyl-ACP methyl ester carboxylesterase
MPGAMELHVETSGQGTPVVLVHSSGLSGRQWKRAASVVVARGFRAVVPDLLGHGRSPAWAEPRPFSFEMDVEQVTGLLQALDQPAHLVGHSYGGLVVAKAALAASARVRSLALYDPEVFGVLDGARDSDARDEIDRVPVPWEATPEGRDRWLSRFVDYWGGAGAWAALREEARAEFRRVAWVVYRGVVSLVPDQTPASAYAALGVPALLMTGEHTPLAARRVLERLGESFADSRTVIVPGAGHMGPMTHADVVAGAIAGFVSER